MVTVAPQVPRYVLSLDELPSVVEADGRVHPVFMTLRDCARIFDVGIWTLRTWIAENDLPALAVNKQTYVEVAALKAWIEERVRLFAQARQVWTWADDEGAGGDDVRSQGEGEQTEASPAPPPPAPVF